MERAIKSVLSQTYQNLECIVVDDASTDNTKEICAGFSQVKYIHIPAEESRGGNYARNTGIKASTGDYIAFLDDDDYWLPEKTEKQLSKINQSNAKVIYCGRVNEIIKDDGEVKYSNLYPNSFYRGDMRKKIFCSIPTTTSALFIDKSTLVNVGLFDENLIFWQEYELLIRLSQQFEFEFVEEPLLVYRINQSDSQRLTNKFNYKSWLNNINYIKNKHKTLINSQDLKTRLKFKLIIADDRYLRTRNSRNRQVLQAKIYYYLYIVLCKIFAK
ncbi:MAG: glycosyltransferase [Muribaculaceae bacterium]|nr:glycosyltransferase [Muribaculaceae bacterium]